MLAVRTEIMISSECFGCLPVGALYRVQYCHVEFVLCAGLGRLLWCHTSCFVRINR